MGWQNRHETVWVLHLWAHGHPSDTEYRGTDWAPKTGRMGYRVNSRSEWEDTRFRWANWLETLGYDCGWGVPTPTGNGPRTST